jgi:ribonuclease P/MRP protein subunit RPP1
MEFHDLHVHSIGESAEQFAVMAKQLGYSSICISEYFKNQQKELQKEFQRVEEKTGMRIYLGFEAKSVGELAKLAGIRRQFDVLLVHGGDLKLNRAACETPEVDILTHPEFGRADSGLNHVLAKAAAENDVAIEVNFRNILVNEGKSRARIVANISQNVTLARKFGAPLVLCSGAVSPWEMRDPMAMVSMAMQVGLGQKEAKDSATKVPEMILKNSYERKSKNWVMPGVKIV